MLASAVCEAEVLFMSNSYLEEMESPACAFELYSVRHAMRDEVAAHGTLSKCVHVVMSVGTPIMAVAAAYTWGFEAWSTQILAPMSLALPWVLCIRFVFHAHERYQSVRSERSFARSRFMREVPSLEALSQVDVPFSARASVTFKVHMQIYGGKIFSIFGICGAIVMASMSLSLYFRFSPASPEYAADVCRVLAFTFGILGGFLLALHVLAFLYNVISPDESERHEIHTELQIRRARVHGEDASGGLSLQVDDAVQGGLSVHQDRPSQS